EIARPMLKHLAQFAGNANGLTLLGSAALLLSALALVLNVENTLNRIWQVRQPRPLPRRLLLYAGLLLAGPAAVGASLWATSHVPAFAAALLDARPTWWAHALHLGPVVLGAAGFACAFRFVPHTAVRWRHAITGGLLAGLAFEAGKRGFALY